jgi:fucose permease
MMGNLRLNTYIGQLKNSTALLGMLHSFYGLGCAISPIVATKMVAAGLGWNSYYYVLLGWAVTNTIIIGVTYHPNFMKSKEEHQETASPTEEVKIEEVIISTPIEPTLQRGPLKVVITNRFCWLVALYLVLYLGLEISTGGWVVEFMIQVMPISSKLTRSVTEFPTKCLMSQQDSG